jgi:outer membrane murein-binding lipoprotein Lpp
MPITGPASFIPTTNEFLAHWALVNAALPPASPLVLVGGITRANLDTHGTSLSALHAAVQAEINDLETARADLDARKAALPPG